MPADLLIRDKEIAFAERVLLKDGEHFDDERRSFIKCLDTVDLQAVPGSGKTTVLLAKLLILDRRLPFSNGSGILVISHTNAAVDEIRHRIEKECCRLFAYPNFVGTIQSFTDVFLGVPSFVRDFGFRPSRIDADAHDAWMARYHDWLCGRVPWLQHQKDSTKLLQDLRFNQDGILTKGLDGKVIRLDPNTPTYKSLEEAKNGVFERGLPHFDDMYYFARRLLNQNGLVKRLLAKRFRFVFVDEMQDMARHQHDILEDLFGDDASGTTLQRIGDQDQAIFSGQDFIGTVGWQQRGRTMILSNSMRLSPLIANVVAQFAYERERGFRIQGLRDVDIKPHILIYDDDTVGSVVPAFAKLIGDLQQTGGIPQNPEAPFYAVAWNSLWHAGREPGQLQVRLVDFCPSFQPAGLRKKRVFDSLGDYLTSIDPHDRTVRPARQAILNGIVHALGMEGVVDPRSERPFTASTLVSFFRDEHPEAYQRFKLSLYRWAMDVVRKDIEGPLRKLRVLIPRLIQRFNKTCATSADFLRAAARNPHTVLDGRSESNTVTIDGVTVHLGTVHSVKGQNHTATLYLESSYGRDGAGPTAKRYESERLADQLKGQPLSDRAGKRVKESSRMVYVGFSRPTHLLAFAVHRTRFTEYLADLHGWDVIDVGGLDICR